MQDTLVQFLPTSIIDKVPNSITDMNYNILVNLSQTEIPGTRGRGDIGKEELNELEKPTIKVKQFTDLHKIPSDKLGDRIRDDNFEYFRIESGMNVVVPVGRIKRLRFYLSIFADGNQSGDALVIDGFPNDKIERVNIVKGHVKLKMNNLLKIIPVPLTQTLDDIVEIDMNPWEINWGYDKLEVGFSEGLNNNVDWFLSGDNVNQSFGCYVTLKKRNTVREVTGNVKAIWEYEPPSGGRLKTWMKEKLNKGKLIIESDKIKKIVMVKSN
jgi:hypothetical protein